MILLRISFFSFFEGSWQWTWIFGRDGFHLQTSISRRKSKKFKRTLVSYLPGVNKVTWKLNWNFKTYSSKFKRTLIICLKTLKFWDLSFCWSIFKGLWKLRIAQSQAGHEEAGLCRGQHERGGLQRDLPWRQKSSGTFGSPTTKSTLPEVWNERGLPQPAALHRRWQAVGQLLRLVVGG